MWRLQIRQLSPKHAMYQYQVTSFLSHHQVFGQKDIQRIIIGGSGLRYEVSSDFKITEFKNGTNNSLNFADITWGRACLQGGCSTRLHRRMSWFMRNHFMSQVAIYTFARESDMKFEMGFSKMLHTFDNVITSEIALHAEHSWADIHFHPLSATTKPGLWAVFAPDFILPQNCVHDVLFLLFFLGSIGHVMFLCFSLFLDRTICQKAEKIPNITQECVCSFEIQSMPPGPPTEHEGPYTCQNKGNLDSNKLLIHCFISSAC